MLKRTAEVAAATDESCRVAGRTNTRIRARPNIISQAGLKILNTYTAEIGMYCIRALPRDGVY